MPLPLNDIRSRALGFAREYRDATSARADSQMFRHDVFVALGIHAHRGFGRQVHNLPTVGSRGRA